MKVFVRTGDLSNPDPIVVASYSDETVVPDNAHGEGLSVLTVPSDAVSTIEDGLPRLKRNWREQSGTMPVEAEARRRIEKDFSVADQVSALYELVTLILDRGGDVSKWPRQAIARRSELDDLFSHVAAIRERARQNPVAPLDPSSDKLWPRRNSSSKKK